MEVLDLAKIIRSCRGAVNSGYYNDEQWAVIQLLKNPVIPEGYKLVPIKPTDEMLNEATRVYMNQDDTSPEFYAYYTAMIEAAE